MNRTLAIVGVIAGYTLFETILVLLYLLPGDEFLGGFGYSRHGLLLLVYFLSIPIISALFSLFLYGQHKWRRRVAIHVSTVPVFLLLMLLIASPFKLLERALWERGLDQGSSRFLIALCQIALLVVLPVSLFLFGREARKRGVDIESLRWLSERRAGIGAAERKWRARAVGWALWIPSLLILPTLLFLPEIWGFMTHIQYPKAGELHGYEFPFTGYEIKIPPTWIIMYQGSDSTLKDSWLFGIAGRGMAFGVGPYLHANVPLSNWQVRTKPSRDFTDLRLRPWILRRYRQSLQRQFGVGGTMLTCQEYVPTDETKMQTIGASAAYIECSSPLGLYGTFEGAKVHVPAFYGMMSSVKRSPPETK